MKTEYLAKLEKVIDKFLNDLSEEGDHPGFVYHTLEMDMAKAAAVVYDASMEVQTFMRAECGVEL